MYSVLVIDDERIILKLLKLALSNYGFDVKTAGSGKEGIEKFETGCFDIVITDMRMPDVDGNAVVRHIRNSNRKFTPVIGISGTPWLLENKVFDKIFSKPFPLKKLTDTVSELVAMPANVANHR